LNYPSLDPIALELGPLSIHWYGLSYLAAFLFFIWYGGRRTGRPNNILTRDTLSNLVFYGVLGIIIGGRLGYMLFYAHDQLLQDPLSLFQVWKGGMSFHGGLVGVLLAITWFARRHRINFILLADSIVPLVPVGLGFGRIGNFINTELPGRITEVPWGLHYPCRAVFELDPNDCVNATGYESILRHPSPLYQFLAEGIVLFIILYLATRTARPHGFLSSLFLLSYGLLRCFTEFFRSPDAGIGYLWGTGLTMGQLLSLPMILLGAYMLVLSRKGRWQDA